MTISAQKSALTSQVNLQGLQQMINVLKVSHSMRSQMREKLWAFLIKLELYIEFNQAKFRFKMNKGLFTVSYLKNAAFDWVDLKLHEFLDKTSKKWMNNKKFIFSNYKKFKDELQEPSR
jgi:bifunctional pyridoxal-dependent enzyme with beta-cystathionase and maltose regulon repressor activities